MGSETAQTLPFIDLTNDNLKPGSSYWLSTAKDVRAAFEEYSCFLAVYDKASKELCNSFIHSLLELFDLPEETKIKNISEGQPFGYYRRQPETPLFESVGIADSTNVEVVESFTKTLWPNGNERFSELMLSYGKKISELDKMITRMLFESYGVERYSDSHINSTVYKVRVNKYKGPKSDETNLGVFAHTDLGFITIIQQSEVDGLEVRLKGGSWVAVSFPPSSYIILAGDGMMAWSNGRIQHCVHRVIIPRNKDRYSTGIFSFHTGVVHVPGEFIDENHPAKFKSFDHFGLVRFRSANPTVPEEDRIKIYCGV
ncbi:hypothetical protein ACH5RR_000917 [Cinchona calisaya]|uniref:Fe2OG dioxygenase domain-containing protein n=1 Tax=Cinchona calisaya TaxID=153742 RepID=A0ABD3B297_9GENT